MIDDVFIQAVRDEITDGDIDRYLYNLGLDISSAVEKRSEEDLEFLYEVKFTVENFIL